MPGRLQEQPGNKGPDSETAVVESYSDNVRIQVDFVFEKGPSPGYLEDLPESGRVRYSPVLLPSVGESVWGIREQMVADLGKDEGREEGGHEGV